MTPEQLLAELPPAKLAAISDDDLINNYLNEMIPATRAPFAAVKEETLLITTDGRRVTAQSLEKHQKKAMDTVAAAMAALNKRIETMQTQ